MLLKFFLYILFFLIQNILTMPYDIHNLQSHLLFKNEICSYNGFPIVENDSIKCICQKGYKTIKNFYLTVANKSTDIQCSYRQKKRFTAFFFAVISPFGFDYFYLGRYDLFIIIIITIIIGIIHEIFFLILKSKLKGDNEFQEYRNSNEFHNRKIRNQIIFYEDEINKRKFIYKIMKKIRLILTIIILCFWVINIFLQGFGAIKDGNGIETEDYMLLLFEVKITY